MKKIAIIIILIFTSNVYSQVNPAQNSGFFSLGVGYTGKFRFLPIQDYIDQIKNNNLGINPIKLPIYLHNIELMTTIGIIPDLRIGLNMGTGDALSEISEFANDSSYIQKSSAYFKNYGIDFTYAIKLTDKFVLSPTLELGLGTMNLSNFAYKDAGSMDWNDLKSTYDRNKSIKDNLLNEFYYAQFEMNFEYALTKFTVFRFGAGYMQSMLNTWNYNDFLELKNKPSSLSANNVNLNFGIFVGIFNY
jgi:hypothetical protein